MMSKALLPALATFALPVHGEVDFARDVRPLLNAHCTSCHGGVKEAGDVSFIYREKALGKGDSGKPIIVPGDPDGSEMMARILSTDPDEVMPKPEHGPRLADTEIATLRQWIQEGAKWGEHWSFVPPVEHVPPVVKDATWPRNDVDRFLLARMEQEGLKPSKEADKAALLRRLSLDLTGLPPSLAELDAFAADESPDAYEKQVSRLLDSPRFGERWASVWMDLARYADSEGLGLDSRRDVWKYRDWLISAFNRDLPYDQFTIEQLAGDLLPDATLDQRIATTFHRLTQANNEGGTDDEEFRVVATMDRVATTWEVWQGVTMGCVQCHSHPYDPIEHRDYFRFMAFFNQATDNDVPENHPVLRVPLDPARHTEAGALQDKIRRMEEQLHETRRGVASRSSWTDPAGMTGSSRRAKLEIVKHDGVEEFRTVGNVAAGAIHTLDIPKPATLQKLTAFRLEIRPIDEATAIHTPEWGAMIRKIELQAVGPDGVVSPVQLAEIIADEAHPVFDPNLSLKGSNRGWGQYTKIFQPRHAIVTLREPLDLQEGATLRFVISHATDSAGGAYPLIAKRGRIALTDDVAWTTPDAGVEAMKKELDETRKALVGIPFTTTPVMSDLPPDLARETREFIRGNWIDKGEVIDKPGTLSVLPPMPAGTTPDRLAMARWMASPENPLTARVAVNRFWLELFGTGIVPTPEDFGSAGERPTHPELLDTLAVRFQTGMKWSMKSLLRELVSSAAYRQDATISAGIAERDADNRLVTRGPRQRLTGEMARDHALSVAGLIAHRDGGPPTNPPLPSGVWKPFDSGDRWTTPAEGNPGRYSRSVYVYWKRSIPYPTLATFDAPSRELCSKRRILSNTPLQALAVLNDPAFHECSKGLARLMKYGTTGDTDARLSAGYRTATSRAITPDRLAELRTLFLKLEKDYAADPDLMKGMAGTPDGAAYTVVASVLLNLDEALIR
ncbi:PSD1 and planctomycete cytochrome C domain-containing protein [Luteolibacter flavescens]|uniref:PSD1 and planctomycete cytochrome C domain-containing protein n=1 Tax=Luteolibacter flavescens TaxID=1859460 RepID=A0ABT3FK01_9BACT|nr:PSD1 and planctomycete cytochrome C domain-containing protein [Luteolibacter flavescens]MCW1883549.1 PSD1 and planctomycete cytochrome C domain-containing protein [Luteolibacter flavescens]